MTTEKRWKRLLAEFTIIVVGVLVALAVDDYRNERADRGLEEHLLVRLRADIQRDLEDLDQVVFRAQRRRWVANALLRGIGDPAAEEVTPYPSEVVLEDPSSGLADPDQDPYLDPLA
jgi:hypothetical protein